MDKTRMKEWVKLIWSERNWRTKGKIEANLKPKTERTPKNYLKNNYLFCSKRMVFTYKNCGCCKKEMTSTKVLLNHIFPAGICYEICNYNLYCFKCKNLNRKEHEFQKEPRRHRTNLRQMKRKIDVLMDTFKLKQKFKHDKLFLIKSFVTGSGKIPITSLKNHDLSYVVRKCWSGGVLKMIGLTHLETRNSM